MQRKTDTMATNVDLCRQILYYRWVAAKLWKQSSQDYLSRTISSMGIMKKGDLTQNQDLVQRHFWINEVKEDPSKAQI